MVETAEFLQQTAVRVLFTDCPQHPQHAGSDSGRLAEVMSNPSAIDGYICNSHARQHWFTVRRVEGQWSAQRAAAAGGLHNRPRLGHCIE